MVTFNYTEEFYRQAKRLAKRYRSLADDLDTLQRYLMENHEIGVSLGEGKRKIRLGAKSKGGGKRGGLRVITLNVVIDITKTCVNLITIYDKLELITLLSSSMVNDEDEVKDAKDITGTGWADRFCGAWKDSRSADEIVDEIRSMRTENSFDAEL